MIIPDPDLGLGNALKCGSDIAEGFKLLVDACRYNPDLYINFESLGSFHNIAATEYTITSATYALAVGGDATQTIGGNWTSQVHGSREDTVVSHWIANIGGEYSLTSQGNVNLTSKQDVNIQGQRVYVNGWRLDTLGSRTADVESTSAELTAQVEDITARLSALEESSSDP